MDALLGVLPLIVTIIGLFGLGIISYFLKGENGRLKTEYATLSKNYEVIVKNQESTVKLLETSNQFLNTEKTRLANQVRKASDVIDNWKKKTATLQKQLNDEDQQSQSLKTQLQQAAMKTKKLANTVVHLEKTKKEYADLIQLQQKQIEKLTTSTGGAKPSRDREKLAATGQRQKSIRIYESRYGMGDNFLRRMQDIENRYLKLETTYDAMNELHNLVITGQFSYEERLFAQTILLWMFSTEMNEKLQALESYELKRHDDSRLENSGGIVGSFANLGIEHSVEIAEGLDFIYRSYRLLERLVKEKKDENEANNKDQPFL